MQSAPFLRALRRPAFLRWPARWRLRGAGADPDPALSADLDADAAVVAVMLGDTCSAARVQRHAGQAQLALSHAGSGGPEMLRQWKSAGWFDNAQVVLVLGSEERQFLTLDRPELPPEEQALAARYPLADAMEVDAESLLATATPMPQTNDALRPQMLAVGARIDPVRARLAQLAAAGVRVRNIDIVDSALRGMVLLQGQAEDGCVALASVGPDICIGLIWQYQFCALRALALPPRTPRDDNEFQEQLALQIQRTADHYERQATRLAVRSVLASMPSLGAEARRTVLSALPMQARHFDLSEALQAQADALSACEGNDDLTALASVAAARLLEPLAQQAAARAQAQESALREAQANAGYEPVGLVPMGAAPGATAATSPAAISQAVIGQAAQTAQAAQAAQASRTPPGAAPNASSASKPQAQRIEPTMVLEDRP